MDRLTASHQVTSKRAELVALAFEMYGHKFGSLTTGKPVVEIGSDLGMLIAAVRRSQVVELYKHQSTGEWMIELNSEGEHPIARLVGALILSGKDQWARFAPEITRLAHVKQWNGFGYGDEIEVH